MSYGRKGKKNIALGLSLIKTGSKKKKRKRKKRDNKKKKFREESRGETLN